MEFNAPGIGGIETCRNCVELLFNPVGFALENGKTRQHEMLLIRVTGGAGFIHIEEEHQPVLPTTTKAVHTARLSKEG